MQVMCCWKVSEIWEMRNPCSIFVGNLLEIHLTGQDIHDKLQLRP